MHIRTVLVQNINGHQQKTLNSAKIDAFIISRNSAAILCWSESSKRYQSSIVSACVSTVCFVTALPFTFSHKIEIRNIAEKLTTRGLVTHGTNGRQTDRQTELLQQHCALRS